MNAEQRIAGRMRDARNLLGISQDQAAIKLGITGRTYARWERCETLGFLGHLAEIARALETTESDLLGGESPLAASATVQDLATKLDSVMEELRQLRQDLSE